MSVLGALTVPCSAAGGGVAGAGGRVGRVAQERRWQLPLRLQEGQRGREEWHILLGGWVVWGAGDLGWGGGGGGGRNGVRCLGWLKRF